MRILLQVRWALIYEEQSVAKKGKGWRELLHGRKRIGAAGVDRSEGRVGI